MFALKKSEIEVAANSLPPSLISLPKSSQRRRRARARICRLYREREPVSFVHATALMKFLQENSPDCVGAFVPQPDLAKFYASDLCKENGWTPRHWNAVGRQLGLLCEKRVLRRHGERFVCYQIPKP